MSVHSLSVVATAISMLPRGTDSNLLIAPALAAAPPQPVNVLG